MQRLLFLGHSAEPTIELAASFEKSLENRCPNELCAGQQHFLASEDELPSSLHYHQSTGLSDVTTVLFGRGQHIGPH